MFIGSINRYMRCVVQKVAASWRGLPVYVACSGNFTIERILAGMGLADLHSNDVSIYSCALGWHLTGQARPYHVKHPDWLWLESFCDTSERTIATLLLLSEMLKYHADNPYARRMRAEYRDRWPELHEKTLDRVRRALAPVKLTSYYAGDCREFLAGADRTGVCVTFPPTYEGGYERLYRGLDEIFDWPAPAYQTFSPDDFEAFTATVRSFRYWLSGSDQERPNLSAHHLATVQTSMLSKPVYIYGSGGPSFLAMAAQKLGRLPWPPRSNEVVEPIQIVQIDAAKMNVIRSMYLSTKITPVEAPRNYVVLSAGRLIGAFSFALPRGPLPCDLYLMTDLAIRPTQHRRLSKLVLGLALSREVQADLEQWLCSRIKTLATTAFTDKPASMKYRGLFEVHSRGEGRINYVAQAGRWSIQEAFQWWKQKHSAA